MLRNSLKSGEHNVVSCPAIPLKSIFVNSECVRKRLHSALLLCPTKALKSKAFTAMLNFDLDTAIKKFLFQNDLIATQPFSSVNSNSTTRKKYGI